MPANLAFDVNGKPMMMYQDESPWHKMGTAMPPGIITAQEALDAASLRWTVSRHPMYLQDGRAVPERFAMLRDDNATILGTVGPNYIQIQNTESAAILDEVTTRYGVSIKTAGALEDGRSVWMLAAMNQQIEPIAGDINKGFMLLSWAHDGTAALTARGTMTRVVCRNTLDMAVSGSRAFISIRHTASASDRIAEATKLMEFLTKNLQDANQTFADLAHASLSREQLAAFINTVVPMQSNAQGKPSKTLTERRDTIAALMRYGVGADLANQAVGRGNVSAWAAYNSVTEYVDHVRPGEAKSQSAVAAANQSAIFGSGAASKRLALDTLIEMVVPRARALVA